jgi:hypothetical protein
MAVADNWITTVERRMKAFARRHDIVFHATSRQVSASFEIGCFHALSEFYAKNFAVTPVGLTPDGEYRYLTSPTGNPANFSYLKLRSDREDFELRQQVRIRSHLHPDIAFTPDLVVLTDGANVESAKDKDYASGKRSFYFVDSSSVIAAHECKSLNPFPELLVGFIGMLVAAHEWLAGPANVTRSKKGPHLAPTLFVGGFARALHTRMIAALERTYPMNVVVGLHSGTWSLLGSGRTLNRLKVTSSSGLMFVNEQKADDVATVVAH